MLRRNLKHERRASAGPAFDNLHDWVLSLPWVVERPGDPACGLRCFAVDCPPLQRKRLWLLTRPGPAERATAARISVILPLEGATASAGLAVVTLPLPAGFVLVEVTEGTAVQRDELEGLILRAYGYAMS